MTVFFVIIFLYFNVYLIIICLIICEVIIFRILVVEDEQSLADLVANRLKKEKYIVDVSLDGEDGMYNALLDIYDLILLDIMLPGVNGIEILK